MFFLECLGICSRYGSGGERGKERKGKGERERETPGRNVVLVLVGARRNLTKIDDRWKDFGAVLVIGSLFT